MRFIDFDFFSYALTRLAWNLFNSWLFGYCVISLIRLYWLQAWLNVMFGLILRFYIYSITGIKMEQSIFPYNVWFMWLGKLFSDKTYIHAYLIIFVLFNHIADRKSSWSMMTYDNIFFRPNFNFPKCRMKCFCFYNCKAKSIRFYRNVGAMENCSIHITCTRSKS